MHDTSAAANAAIIVGQFDLASSLALLETGFGTHFPARVHTPTPVQVEFHVPLSLFEMTAAFDGCGARVVERENRREDRANSDGRGQRGDSASGQANGSGRDHHRSRAKNEAAGLRKPVVEQKDRNRMEQRQRRQRQRVARPQPCRDAAHHQCRRRAPGDRHLQSFSPPEAHPAHVVGLPRVAREVAGQILRVDRAETHAPTAAPRDLTRLDPGGGQLRQDRPPVTNFLFDSKGLEGCHDLVCGEMSPGGGAPDVDATGGGHDDPDVKFGYSAQHPAHAEVVISRNDHRAEGPGLPHPPQPRLGGPGNEASRHLENVEGKVLGVHRGRSATSTA